MNWPPKKILFTPLDWGLGHLTRCIPIIKACLQDGHSVCVAGTPVVETLIRALLPELDFLPLPGYQIEYSRQSNTLPWKLLIQLPRVLRTIQQEHHLVNRYIKEYQFDLIISDNRYGTWSPHTPSWFITHQLNIQVPFSALLQRSINRKIHAWIRRFDRCWVPDYPDHLLSGKLSESNYGLPVSFLGPLSHLSNEGPDSRTRDLLFILSGPEPQRSLLESIICEQVSDLPGRHTLVRGTRQGSDLKLPNERLRVVDMAEAGLLSSLIKDHQVIVCRSGYSTLMDLVRMQRSAIIIPTPGQTEQEYLAEYMHQKSWFLAIPQQSLQLNYAIALFRNMKSPSFPVWDTSGLEIFLQTIRNL